MLPRLAGADTRLELLVDRARLDEALRAACEPGIVQALWDGLACYVAPVTVDEYRRVREANVLDDHLADRIAASR